MLMTKGKKLYHNKKAETNVSAFSMVNSILISKA